MSWFAVLCEDDQGIVSTVAGLLKIKPDEANKRIAALDIDDALALIDAVADFNAKKIRALLDQEEDHVPFGVGEDADVNGEEAVVAEPDGPSDTIGVLINGEMKMVDKDDVRPLEEAVLGVSRMPGLRQMMELAFQLPTGEDKSDDEDEKEDTEEADEASATDEPEVEAEAKATDDETSGQKTGFPQQEPTENPGDIANSVSTEPETQSCLSRIESALGEIESAMPELKVSEYKRVADRLTRIQNSIFEAAHPKRRR